MGGSYLEKELAVLRNARDVLITARDTSTTDNESVSDDERSSDSVMDIIGYKSYGFTMNYIKEALKKLYLI